MTLDYTTANSNFKSSQIVPLLEQFIQQKSKQIVYFLKGFWDDTIPYKELDFYVWDTLEEWIQLPNTSGSPYSGKEKVFWHLIHQMHAASADCLKRDHYLISQLNDCIHYLEQGGVYLISV
jgi:hypothetical protein